MVTVTLVTNVEEDADLIEFAGTSKKKQRKIVDCDSDSDSDKEEAPTEAEIVDTVPAQQLKRYVDLLSVESADNYEKWMKVGLILFKYNNSKSSYELFKAFSKKSSKYDAHCCKLKWNSFANKKYDRSTLGTLKSYAGSDSNEEYDKLECVAEALYFETLDIDQSTP
jgi:hypothetical protein